MLRELGLIDLENVAYTYSGGELLSEMTLSIASGAFYFLTGPSGSGKTTFLKMCYGALVPTAGNITIFGQDLRTMTRDDIALTRRRIGVVHQDCQFLDHLNVVDNIALPLAAAGQDSLADGANLKELLNWVGLGHRADALPPELSGGERQRAALARAVIMSPDIILADEPTGNLDPQLSSEIMSLFEAFNQVGVTVLVATHDLPLISRLRHRIITLHEGRLAGVTAQ